MFLDLRKSHIEIPILCEWHRHRFWRLEEVTERKATFFRVQSQSETAPRHAFAHLFFALLAFTALAPLTTGGVVQRVVYFVLTLAVVSSVVRLSWLQPRTRLIVLLLAIPATIAAALGAFAFQSPVEPFLSIFAVAFLIIAAGQLLRKIVRDTVVTGDTLYGAACIYLLIGITWALLYYVLSRLQPGTLFYAHAGRPVDIADGWPNYVYFSFTTLATAGYGDITPATQVARSVVILELISGVFYVAMLIGRLVDLYRPSSK